jgi:hypothetical protein
VHVIQSRAIDGTGIPGPVDAISITLNNKVYSVYFPYIVRRWPPVPYTPFLNPIENADQDDSFTVSWTYNPGSPQIPVQTYTLEEDTTTDFDNPTAYPTTATSRAFSGHAPGQFYFRVRGDNIYGHGQWSNIQSVIVLPGTPVLNPINNPDRSPSYTVSWSAATGAESYKLEEARDSGFTDTTVVYSGPALTYQATGKASGTYYYRVKSVYQSLSSQWSNVVSTDVQAGFFDDFSSTGSGWPQATYDRGTTPDGPVMNVGYSSGTYRMKILLNTSGLNNKRMGAVKAPFVNPFGNYDVEVDHFFARANDQVVDPTWGKAGLIFGANDTYSTIYVVEWHFPQGGATPQCAVYRYNQMSLPTTIVFQAGGTALRDWSGCPALKGGYDQTNRVRVEVRGSQATVYFNSTKLGTFGDAGIASSHRVGLETGSWELTPVESRFDNFRVTPK